MTLEKSASWMMLLVVVILSVVGVFFALTDPTSWPERSTQLSSTDMKLMRPSPTVWCEAVAMWSHHDFVVYKVPAKPDVNSNTMSKSEIYINPRTLRRLDHLELKYHLLNGSMVEVRAIASTSSTILRIFKGHPSRVCFETSNSRERAESSLESESGEDSSHWSSKDEEEDIRSSQCPRHLESHKVLRVTNQRDTGNTWANVPAVHFNVTTTDDYTIVLSNQARHEPSDVSLYLLLDRTRYDTKKSRDNVHVCSTSSVCLVPLSFASTERTVVSIPAEAEAGLDSYTVSTRCRPRISVFALMTVLFPILLFALINTLVKFDRRRMANRRRSAEHAHNAPFLTHQSHDAPVAKHGEDLPPTYEMVCLEPPSYASVRNSCSNKEGGSVYTKLTV